MAHLSNPLTTPAQLYKNADNIGGLPVEIQDSIRYYTARLTQAAGILLRLPQDITAQANVLLFRFWAVESLVKYEYSEVSAAVLYLTSKVSASPRSLRNITNVYAYLTSTSSALLHNSTSPRDPDSYYLSEGNYYETRSKILHLEGQILNALGFNTHVALPHSLAITYLQTLDVFASSENGKNTGSEVAKRTIEYLNTALLSPQMLYLTHQPCALAAAAIYLAARDKGVKLPDCEWWEVFDCEREELGFLVLAMRSLEGVVIKAEAIFGGKGMIAKKDVEKELESKGISFEKNGHGRDDVESEEEEMARLMDEKVGGS